jgi:long-chain acyl-CoA synthetase
MSSDTVIGSLETSALAPARIALSVPLVNVLNHPLVAGPVMASHPLDLQIFPTQIGGDEFSPVASVGPPSVNVEVKLNGVNDNMVKDGGDPVGTMSVRGPSVGQALGRDNGPTMDEPEGEWVETGLTAKVLSNGTFKISYFTK